jgi:methylated-DNA-[protein]-cysteine S-methyltransferase
MKYYLFNYKYPFLAFTKNNEIIKIKPYFGKWKNNYKIPKDKIEITSFEELKKLKINFSLYSENYKKLYSILKDKRLYTYSEVAKQLNISPFVLGRILNKNPFLILIPCNRVVKKDDIGGYVLGINIKKELLKFEGLLS